MALSIKNPEADRLAKELVAATGESVTEAVVVALRQRVERVRGRRASAITRRLDALSAEVAAYPVVTAQSAEEIIGYDEHGLPA